MKIKENTLVEYDFCLKDLSEAWQKKLLDSDMAWLNSLPFCTGYGEEYADRVWLLTKNEVIKEAIFYRIDKGLFVSVMDVKGFTEADDATIKKVMTKHGAHLVLVNRMEPAVKPDEQWQPPHSHIYLKEYITIASLPDSKETYLNSMGKNKKKQLPQYLRRIYREFEGVIDIRFEYGQAIQLKDTILLECLNRNRRASKGKGVDTVAVIEDRQRRLYPLVKKYGLLVTIRHNETILGGNLNLLYGNTAYMVVTGHDSQYEALRIGYVAIWQTMEHLIEKGFGALNFLWGRKLYKTQFGGVEHPWAIHILSNFSLLAIFWKYKIAVSEFYRRGVRFLRTRFLHILKLSKK